MLIVFSITLLSLEDICATEDVKNTTCSNPDQGTTEISNLTNTDDTPNIVNSTDSINITSSNTTSTDHAAAGGDPKTSHYRSTLKSPRTVK